MLYSYFYFLNFVNLLIGPELMEGGGSLSDKICLIFLKTIS